MPTLTSLLSRDAIVPLDIIERALQRQVLEDGEIDLALLELGAVSENVLSAYRAATFGLKPVARAKFENIDPALLAQLPSHLALSLNAVPIERTDDCLVLARAWPLSPEQGVALSGQLGVRVSVRIANEPRVRLALCQYYGAEPSSRLRLLRERLLAQDPGELCEVRTTASMPLARAIIRVPQTQPEAAPLRAVAVAPSPRAASSSSASMPAVRVVPVVRLGIAPPSNAPDADQHDADDTRPARPSNMVRPLTTSFISGAPTKRISRPPNGPLTRQQAAKLLVEAYDRDRVLEVFFAFARQYFECTVLFAVRDERLLGLEASGLPSPEHLRAVEVPLMRNASAPGAIQAVMLSRQAQVLPLRGTDADRLLIEAIDRGHAQPCALIPVVIRQRVVSLLYGDRGGEPITLAALADLIQTLPAVSSAFERIIHERKLQVIDARRERQSGRPLPVHPDQAFRPQSSFAQPPSPAMRHYEMPTQTELHRQQRGSAPRSHRFATPPARRAARTQDHDAMLAVPPPPRLPAEATYARRDLVEDVTQKPTIQFPRDTISRDLQRPSHRPPKSLSYSQHDELLPRGRSLAKPDLAPPGQHAKLPVSREQATPSVSLDPPPPRTFSQPPPGAGSYAMRSAREDAPEQPSAGPASAATHSARPPEAPRASLRPPEADVSVPLVVVDLRGEAERLVEKLCQAGPDDEQPIIKALLPLGDAALLALSARFPGPLWFDRHKARQNMPAGRDISAIARALYAFEERAIDYLADLLTAASAERRLCAILLATDRVCAELLTPVCKCLFDPEGQVRLQAATALPFFRNVEGFGEARRSLRQKAADDKEPTANRLAALEAIGALRDAGSVEVLAKLCGHPTRQLSVPAHRALMAITAQDFGDSERKWKAWLDKNKDRHRAEWLIDGLMHPEDRLRSLASLELQKLTQVYYGFSATAGKREREQVQRRYREWWQTEGHVQFGA